MCQPEGPPSVAGQLELADLFRRFIEELPPLTPDQARAVHDIMRCRTAELGGHIYHCDHCGYRAVVYNSCRNRHCPKCQGLAQARWLTARSADLLPVEYHHVVFTVPSELRWVFLVNQAVCYKLLFAAVSETLKEVALTRLGGRIGLTAVLHTWTQKLL
jgi:hypothetical protein